MAVLSKTLYFFLMLRLRVLELFIYLPFGRRISLTLDWALVRLEGGVA